MSETSSNHPRLLRLDAGWRFHVGDIDLPLPNTHIGAYMANKAGYARGAAKPGYDDSDWPTVDLPHDWSIEGSFDPSNHLDAAFLPRGVAWYRRHFLLDESDSGKYLAIRFDGVATHCTVYVNGHLLHRNWCGYTPFTVDISDVATFGEGEVNTIAVRVDATYMEGWWYEGAGIYRHAWLIRTSKLHVATDAVFVDRRRSSAQEWLTDCSLDIANATDQARTVDIDWNLLDPAGNPVAGSKTRTTVAPRMSRRESDRMHVTNPRLWSPQNPDLYSLRIVLREPDGGPVLDEISTVFGYRTIRLDPDRGLFLNDQPLKLLGTCNHQDHAGVGVAVPDSIHEFRIRRLKEMGCNAYRCAHNPPAPELLEACDRLGMLVIDENRNFGSSPEHLEQLRAMVQRDRNHPSVILWSICNEEAIQATPIAANIARAMQAVVQELDPSRPVTAAVSGGVLGDGGIGHVIDVMGINYQLATHDEFHAKHPEKAIVAAETHCAMGTRGTYETNAERRYFASYDDETAPWGTTAREAWRHISTRPFVAGLFAWTGFDYRGEPSPHGWPCVNSHWGIMDTCGFAKDAFYLHKAFFTREPFLHLLPHWNWPGREGQMIRVKAYTTCQSVELFLNDRSLGKKQVDPIEMVEWAVPYEPGSLRAVGYHDQRALASAMVETTGAASALGLEIPSACGAQGSDIPADGAFAVPVTVFATDADGRRVPTADAHVRFSVEGPARILGVGNGDPTSHEPDKASERSLFRGLAQVIIQTTTTPGPIRVHARADTLERAVLELHAHPAPVRPSVPAVTRRHFITEWRISPPDATRPDPNQSLVDSDMNSWERVKLGQDQQPRCVPAGHYAIYRATFNPPKVAQARGGTIVIRQIIGAADALLQGRTIARKSTYSPGELTLPLPAAIASVTLSLLVHAPMRAAGGVMSAVEIVPNEQSDPPELSEPSEAIPAGGTRAG